MAKILTIALTEVRAFLRTKAFIVSMLLLPTLSMGSVLLQKQLANVDKKTRTFAVLDLEDDMRPASLYAVIELAAQERDSAIASGTSKDGSARYIPKRVTATPATVDALRLDMSAAIRREELFAFIELPRDFDAIESAGTHIAYHSDAPTYGGLRTWLEQVLTKEVRARRYRAAGIGPGTASALERSILTDNRGLWQVGPNGEVQAAAAIDKVRLIVGPTAAVLLMWMLVLVTAPQLMQAVQEEKSSRISEVLLGSVTSFELMLGKLIGGIIVSSVLATVYVTGVLRTAASFGFPNLLPPAMLAWFGLFLLLSLLMYGSIYLAIGAACNDGKSAQSMMMPVVMIQVIPLLLLRPVIESPAEPLAVATSLFPLTTPSIMVVRLGLHPAPPLWQVILGIGLTVTMTLACVWAAGRVFRVGLLLSGKSPSIRQIARWVFASP